MYATLVPTAGEGEAEETANWEYGEDAKGLPLELGRVGIPLGAFSDALFDVADNVGEGKLTAQYMKCTGAALDQPMKVAHHDSLARAEMKNCPKTLSPMMALTTQRSPGNLPEPNPTTED